MLIFDPRKVDVTLPEGVHALSYKDVEKRAQNFQREIIAERTGKGEKAPELVPVTNRKNGEVRWFNLRPEYPGSLNLAEAMLYGQWRVATKEEEAAAIQLQVDAKNQTMAAAAAKLAVTQAASLAGALAAQTINAQAAATAAATTPPATQSAEPAKAKHK